MPDNTNFRIHGNRILPFSTQWRIDIFMFDYISTNEAAARLCISRRRVQALIHEKRLQAERVGKTYVVYVPSVELFERHLPWHQLALQRQAEFQAQWDEWEREQREWEQQQPEYPSSTEQPENSPEQLQQQSDELQQLPPGSDHD